MGPVFETRCRFRVEKKALTFTLWSLNWFAIFLTRAELPLKFMQYFTAYMNYVAICFISLMQWLRQIYHTTMRTSNAVQNVRRLSKIFLKVSQKHFKIKRCIRNMVTIPVWTNLRNSFVTVLCSFCFRFSFIWYFVHIVCCCSFNLLIFSRVPICIFSYVQFSVFIVYDYVINK